MNTALLTQAWQALTKRSLPADEPLSAVIEFLADALHLVPSPETMQPIAPLPPIGSKQRIALCLGHARAGDEGAGSADGMSEKLWNKAIITSIAAHLRHAGIVVIPVYSYEGNGYGAAMKWLAQWLLEQGATAAIEFHFNAANTRAVGHEFLYWNKSVRGVTLAKDMALAFDEEFTESIDRGLKSITSADRGAAFLALTHCPACIAEPFFGDNSQEWNLFNSPSGIARLVSAYVAGITNWVASQS